MKALIALAVATIIALGYAAQAPSEVAALVEQPIEFDREAYVEQWLTRAHAGVEAGNPFWESSYGTMLLDGPDWWKPPYGEKLEADPDLGFELIERAATKGLATGYFSAWMLSNRTDDESLQRAVELGEPNAVTARLLDALESAECSENGFAILEGEFPSLADLEANRERTRALFDEFGAEMPHSMSRFPEVYDRAHDEAADMLRRVEAGLPCEVGAGC